jgi:hypothetical protein
LSALVKLFELESRGESVKEATLFGFHLSPISSGMIVEAAKMEHPMNQVTDQLALPGGAKAARLVPGFGQTDKEVTAKPIRSFRVGVIEGDDVGRARVLEVGLVHSDHRALADEVNAELKLRAL